MIETRMTRVLTDKNGSEPVKIGLNPCYPYPYPLKKLYFLKKAVLLSRNRLISLSIHSLYQAFNIPSN